MAHRLAAKVAIITGANSGMGLATARLFQRHGAKVASLDVNPSSDPETENFLPLKCDISSQSRVNECVGRVLEKWSTVDILINNAGILEEGGGINELSVDVWQRVMNINLNGPMYMTKAVLPTMLRNKSGVIVNTCSVSSLRGACAPVAYTTSKHGLLGFTRSTAWMYAKDGIRCNAVFPGMVVTGMTKHVLEKFSSGEEAKGEIPSRLAPYGACCPEVCQPEEVAEAFLFLATSPAANGAEVAMDKGWLTA